MDIAVAAHPWPWHAWRALPRAVRKEVHRLAKVGHGHPDPAVARTAIAWGRAVRRAAGWPRALVVTLYMGCVGMMASVRIEGPPLWRMAPIAVFGAAFMAGSALLDLYRRATRAEHANLRAVLLTERSSWPDIGTAPVTIHRGRRIRWSEIACVPPAAFILLPDPDLGGPDEFSFVCAAVVAVLFAALFVRVRPGGRTPLMVLSPDGLQLPHRGVTMPWSALAWADVVVKGDGYPQLALLWTLTSADAIVIPISWMVEEPEVALTASWRFAEAAR
jgi:hypothetical protein